MAHFVLYVFFSFQLFLIFFSENNRFYIFTLVNYSGRKFDLHENLHLIAVPLVKIKCCPRFSIILITQRKLKVLYEEEIKVLSEGS